MRHSQGTLDAIVQRMAALYVSSRKRYVVMGQVCFVPPGCLTDAELRRHIEGKTAIAIFGGPKASRFVCFDIDDGQAATARAVMNALAAFGFPQDRIYLSTSGGKGYHVEVFFDAFAYTNQLKLLYCWLIRHTGLSERQVEFRPTAGQAVKLPLCKHHKTGNMCWYLDRNTFAPIQSFEYILGIEKVPEADFIGMCQTMAAALYADDVKRKMPREKKEKRTGNALDVGRLPIYDGQNYRQLAESGIRHQMMCDIAVHQRYSGMERKACHDCLAAWYRAQDPRLIQSSYAEVVADIGKIVEWVYGEGFRVGDKHGWRGQGILSRSDMLYIISQKTRSNRKVCFLLVARARAKCAAISHHEMAKVLGMSKQTVLSAIQQLVADGVILCAPGRRWLQDDGFNSQPNAYTLDAARLPEGDGVGYPIHGDGL